MDSRSSLYGEGTNREAGSRLSSGWGMVGKEGLYISCELSIRYFISTVTFENSTL